MALASRRIVLTGIGILNPLGDSLTDFWNHITSGRSGIQKIRSFDASACPSHMAGEIPDFDAKKYIDKKDRKGLRVMARPIQFAVCAAQLAVEDCKLDKTRVDPARFGVEFGAGLIPSEPEDLGAAATASVKNSLPVDLRIWGEQVALPNITPLWMLKYLPNMPACHISVLHNAQGPSNSITEGDAASLLALGEAYRIISRDDADFFLVGGADSALHPMAVARHCLFAELSRRNDTPESACRPFDQTRDGAVLGEGACVLAVEELTHAQKRGARIYAEMVGFGSAFDRNRNGRNIALAMRAALTDAGLTPDDIDHVNAHGLGSVAMDAREAAAIHEVLGSCKRPVPVFAGKSYFGNTFAASGTSELTISVLAMVHGQLPRTLNYERPDPACPVAVTRESRPIARPFFLKIGFNDLGQCAVVVCRKWD